LTAVAALVTLALTLRRRQKLKRQRVSLEDVGRS
jgi:hypothetical protein